MCTLLGNDPFRWLSLSSAHGVSASRPSLRRSIDRSPGLAPQHDREQFHLLGDPSIEHRRLCRRRPPLPLSSACRSPPSSFQSIGGGGGGGDIVIGRSRSDDDAAQGDVASGHAAADVASLSR